MRYVRWIFLVLAIGWLTPPATAENASIKAFYGSYSGSAVVKNRDSTYFGVAGRDMGVTIAPAGKGFKVTWSAVKRGRDASGKPKIKRKEASLTFLPAGEPAVYKAAEAKDPLAGGAYSWARIRGQTLIVNIMVINRRGEYEMSTYERRLVGDGLQIKFLRVRDGARVRIVAGKAVRKR